MKPHLSLKPLLLITPTCIPALAAQVPAKQPARSKAVSAIAGIADAAKVVSLYSDDG
jgi:hypothetical protein